jgi:phosphopentomutase
LAKGVSFRSNVLPNLLETDLKQKKLKEINKKNTTNAINVLTDAIKYRRARRALDVELKQKQKKVYESLKDKYKPVESLAYNPLIIHTNEFKEQNKQQIKRQELNKKIEIMGRKRLATLHLTQYPL